MNRQRSSVSVLIPLGASLIEQPSKFFRINVQSGLAFQNPGAMESRAFIRERRLSPPCRFATPGKPADEAGHRASTP